MIGIMHFETFLLAGIVLNLTPGNDTVFILTKSIGQGKRAGIISALGIGTGSIVHTILAALGLSIIIAKSFFIFNIIKYAGAAYLFYLGYKMLKDAIRLTNGYLLLNKQEDNWKIYRSAVFANILNPKVALFFLAFLPQFIDPTLQNTIVPFLILGATFITTGTLWGLILATFASRIVIKLKNNKNALSYINKICGLTIIGLGVKVAMTSPR
jgi:RhtB (resistance to homoserine/threonine) family protein